MSGYEEYYPKNKSTDDPFISSFKVHLFSLPPREKFETKILEDDGLPTSEALCSNFLFSLLFFWNF